MSNNNEAILDRIHEAGYLRKILGLTQRPDGYSDCKNPNKKLIARYYEVKKELADLITSNHSYRD